MSQQKDDLSYGAFHHPSDIPGLSMSEMTYRHVSTVTSLSALKLVGNILSGYITYYQTVMLELSHLKSLHTKQSLLLQTTLCNQNWCNKNNYATSFGCLECVVVPSVASCYRA